MHLKPDQIAEIFVRLAGIPHKLLIRIENEDAEAFVLNVVKNHLIISEFEPRLTNLLLQRTPTIQVQVSEVYEFVYRSYTFKTTFHRETEHHESRAYEFLLPDSLRIQEKPYIIQPEPSDNTSVSFRTKDIQQFKKVSTLSQTELVFTGTVPFISEIRNTRIDHIELKLPFRRIWTSGILQQINESTFRFTDYIQHEDDWHDLTFYATDNFVIRNRLQRPTAERREVRESGGVEIIVEPSAPPPPVILIADDKPVITRVMKELLEARSDYKIITTNTSREVLPLTVTHKPVVVILDLHMPDLNGVEIARQLSADPAVARIPILFMTASGDQSLELDALKIAEVLEKPVESQELLDKIAALVRQGERPTVDIGSKIYICCDDTNYFSKFDALNWESCPQPDRALYASPNKIRAIFLRLTHNPMSPITFLNLLRARSGCERLPVFVQARNAGEFTLLSALKDSNLTIIPAEMSATDLAAQYLEHL